MTAESLAVLAGVILSLAFSYIPGLSAWFDALDRQGKQIVVGASLVIVALALFGLACAGLASQLDYELACTTAGAIGLFKILAAALVANQTTYLVTRK